MSEENPFQPPSYAYPAAPPGMVPQRTSWFTVRVRIIMAVCVLLSAGLGAGAALGISLAANTGVPGTGDCLYLTQQAGGQAYHRASCSDLKATYKVDDWQVGSGSCELGDYVKFQVFSSGERSSRTLCLALNVTTGDCLRDVTDRAKIAKVACSDPAAENRVSVLSHTIYPEECTNAVKAFVYSGPPERVVCLVAAGEHI